MWSTLPLTLYNLANPDSKDVIPTNTKDFLNPFFGGPRSYSGASLKDVLTYSRVQLAQIFGNRFVFIGESGTAIHDDAPSPVTGEKMD